MAMLLVAGILAAAIQASTSAVAVRAKASDREFAVTLAEALIAEVLAKPYADPSGATPLGLDAGESWNPRLTNDVDDYDGLTESPPFDASGSAIPGATGWRRAVRVELVNPADPTATVATDQGAKRVTVTVYKGGSRIVTLVAVRTLAWDRARSSP